MTPRDDGPVRSRAETGDGPMQLTATTGDGLVPPLAASDDGPGEGADDSLTVSLYDTLSGEVRPLELREPGNVSLYACGPTVYDHPHLGHARSALTYDVLRRYLEWRGLDVRHVANITDIDDKIIDRARSEGRTEAEVAQQWEDVYFEAMGALGVLEPHERPRATEWVSEMVDFVERIVDVGAAYATPTGVYLRVRGVCGYGDLVGRSLDDLRAGAGARVEVDDDKEDPLDFALWKAAKPGEPSWDSPWGPGRPGWHIECVAMSLGILGDGFDIHGGGSDLVFPHHTNERAEALAVGRPFARHWVHNAMLNIDGVKMAKSVGNYRTVGDLLAEHPLNGRAFRLLVLQTHYRKTMEVNADLMASARAAVRRLDALARRISALATEGPAAKTVDLGQLSKDEAVEWIDQSLELSGAGRRAKKLRSMFEFAMDRDLATSAALSWMFEALHRANAAFDEGSVVGPVLGGQVIELFGVLGLNPEAGSSSGAADAAIEELIQRRQAARQAKDWATADALRDELAAQGVAVEDTPTGPIWHRP